MDEVAHLFVYGTLQPGDVRWHFLAPYVIGEAIDDAVAGTLYDTGRGYPAAIFGGDHLIRGRTYELDRQRLAVALDVLDTEEASVAGSFTRVAVTTRSGVTAWAYAYGNGLQLWRIDGGDWSRR